MIAYMIYEAYLQFRYGLKTDFDIGGGKPFLGGEISGHICFPSDCGGVGGILGVTASYWKWSNGPNKLL